MALYHISGAYAFTDPAVLDQFIVEHIRHIPETDRRPTRTVLADRFGYGWSGQKLKQPIFELARAGHLVCMGSGRYVISSECSIPPPACPAPPKAVWTVGDTNDFDGVARDIPVYALRPGGQDYVAGCPDWQPDRPWDFRNLVVHGALIRDMEDVLDDDPDADVEGAFTALLIYPYGYEAP